MRRERWIPTATDRLFVFFSNGQTHAVQRGGLFPRVSIGVFEAHILKAL